MILRLAVSLSLGLPLAGLPLAGITQDQAVTGNGAVLRALDKLNGKTRDVELRTGQVSAVFGLEVDLLECRYPAENPTGEAYAFVQIRDEGKAEIAFEGWMVASSPALNAMDHPRYDVWVIRCITS